jgi:hypothetical protein
VGLTRDRFKRFELKDAEFAGEGHTTRDQVGEEDETGDSGHGFGAVNKRS